LSPAADSEPVHLFAPEPALRLEREGAVGPTDGQNPADGAVFDYQLAAPPAGAVTLEVLDAQGRLIRRFSNETQRAGSDDATVKGADNEPAAKPLPTHIGLNRYVWNLRLAPFTPVSDTIRFVSYRPPRVGPGVYRVRLTVDGRAYETALRVLPQPDLPPATAAQWADQQALAHQLYDMVNDDHAVTAAVRRRVAVLEASGGDPALIATLEAWQEQVPQAPLPAGVQDKVGFPSRLLSTQILHALNIADQPPPVGEALRQRATDLAAQWAAMKRKAEALLAE
jgi:hypothetical protein